VKFLNYVFVGFPRRWRGNPTYYIDSYFNFYQNWTKTISRILY